MHDLASKNHWTGTRTITAAGNRTCTITLRLSDFKSKTSLGCFLVLRKLLFGSFCAVVWVLFSVFSIFCITSLVSATPRNHPSLTLLLRYYELTNENVSYFLTNQSKTKTFIDLKVTRKLKPTKNSTRPCLNEIPAHCTHEIKTKGYEVIGVNLFLRKLMKFLRKKVE